MKMALIAPLRRWLAALAPGSLRDTLNRRPRIVNLIAVMVILLVAVDVGRQLGLPRNLFTARHSFASRPKPLRFLNVRDLHCPAQFITAMVSDGHGGAWVGSEDSGIYHYQPGSAWQYLWENNGWLACFGEAQGVAGSGTYLAYYCGYIYIQSGNQQIYVLCPQAQEIAGGGSCQIAAAPQLGGRTRAVTDSGPRGVLSGGEGGGRS